MSQRSMVVEEFKMVQKSFCIAGLPLFVFLYYLQGFDLW